MKNTLITRFCLLSLSLTASLGLGISMPQCQGQQELEQKYQILDAAHKELTKKLQALTKQVETTASDMGQVKTLLPQITGILSTQKDSMDKLENELKALHGKSKGKKK